MAVKIRLARAGAKKAPFYRVIVADSRSPRDGRFIEIIGRYNPRTQPSTVELDVEKAEAWIAKGAIPTEVASKLIAIAKGETTAPVKSGQKLSKKAVAKKEAAAKKAAEPAPEPAPVAEAVAEAPAEETPAETPAEAPVEVSAEGAPVEASAAETTAEEATAEEAPVETPADEAPAEEAAAETEADEGPAAEPAE